jgi:hypothetical protein
MDKKIRKRSDRKCHFCDEDNYELLDLHRIIPGSEGGKYKEYNVVTVCCKCHRKIHAGIIEVYRWCMSTAGYVLYCKIDDEEKFI